MDEDHYVTTAEAGRRFGVSSVTVTRWIKQGYLRAKRKGPTQNSGWLIPESEVRRLETQLAGSASTGSATEASVSEPAELTETDIDAASEAWDAAMPDFAGLLDADQVGSTGSPTGEG